ncbi:MAG TPA: segregation/condensation protein A [Clostridiales bacterium]|nr:segregation/condensation protein A [Clostridiales bacterium]
MPYLVKLQQFEGPLDLLLHLISKSKVRIEDISITEITEQYLETLHMMEQFDIEIASEFLVMAATLLHIKSCILVPKAKPEMEELEEPDPKQELITRLLEYKKYKEAGNKLKEREAYYSGIFYKLPEELFTNEKSEVLPPDVNIDLLHEALCRLLQSRQKLGSTESGPAFHEIKRDTITINDRIDHLKNYFSMYSKSTFFSIFEDDSSREEIIMTFLALLELLKVNYLEVQQDYPFGDIIIKRRNLNG